MFEQAVLATRRELQEYDRQQRQASTDLTSPLATPVNTPCITTPGVMAAGHPLSMTNQLVQEAIVAQAKPRERYVYSTASKFKL